MRTIPRFRTLTAFAAALAVLGASAAPVLAWNTPNHQYHLKCVNNTGGFVNDDSIYIMARSDNGPWVPPTLLAPPFSPTWAWANPPLGGIVGNCLAIKFTGAPNLPNGGTVIKNVYIKVPGDGNPFQSAIFERWTFNGVAVGQRVALGFCTSSPARIANPNVTPEGAVNTANMVVRNLQFAQSPSYIPNDQLTPDYPPALALFAASLDPVRAGPIIATPGTCQDISPDIHASITAPVSGGQTVLAKGIVEDGVGNQYQFMCQFVAPPLSTPGVTVPGLILLTLSLIVASAIWIERRRRAGRTPEATV